MTAYLDNAATTRVRPEAARAVMEAMTENYGNPSSGHSAGLAAAEAVSSARAELAAAIGAAPGDVCFVSGGSEADNWSVFGVADACSRKGRHIVSTAVEHEAVLEPLKALSARGWDVTLISPEKDGSLDAARVLAAVREDTVLVSVMSVNNETGCVFPVADISRGLRAMGSSAVLHTDAVQAFLKIPLTVKGCGADLISLSSHKIHGPKGCGALYIGPSLRKKGVRLKPMIYGGGQESGRRSGTEAVPVVAGFGAAVKAGRAVFAESAAHMAALRAGIIERLRADLPEAVVIGGGAPHILTLALPGYGSEVLMNYLNSAGICVSRGSACAKGRRSHVLTAMGLAPELIDSSIRVSLSPFTTREETELFCRVYAGAKDKIFKKL